MNYISIEGLWINLSAVVTIDDAIKYLDTFRDFVIQNDIPCAISCKANYLVALGLSTYTEILGGLYSGDLSGNHRYLRDNYIDFIKHFFPPDYMKVDSQLAASNLKGLYSVVRSGLTHEFFVKTISRIDMDSPANITCGISYDPHDSPQVIFYVKKYFEDFRNAFEKYYSQLKSDASLSTNFGKAIQSVKSNLLGRLSASETSFIEDVSGKGFP
ncbi:MAG: hypothetical protein WA323_18500 [Candidatus Nitrosopolaris sp.]